MTKGPRARYNSLVKSGALSPDAAQAAGADALDHLHKNFLRYAKGKSGLFGSKKPPKGLYLWGEVGRGKTLLMDIFFNNTNFDAKKRVHFHEFMAETHDRITYWRTADEKEKRKHKSFNRKAPDDPIPLVAGDIAREALLLCFDEFQVTDIADAMILGRLFTALFSEGVVTVATSNRPPDDLYKDGLNRQLFVPFIELLKDRLEVHELAADHDYRLEKLESAPVYYQPLGPDADTAMDRAWQDLICGATERAEELTVKGRTLIAPRTARGAARFEFAELCERPLGASDYLALAGRYGALFLDHIPKMGPANRNEAKRFVTLIDALYDARTKLVCSADGEPIDLYTSGDGSFEFERTVSRLMEMRSAEYLAAAHELASS